MPVWEAQYVIVISSKTGWNENYIRHDLPLSRGYAYFHAARLLERERCVWPGKPSACSRWVDNVRQWVKSVTP